MALLGLPPELLRIIRRRRPTVTILPIGLLEKTSLHLGYSTTLTVGWFGGIAHRSDTIVTPTAPGCTFVPATITLTSSGSSINTATMTVGFVGNTYYVAPIGTSGTGTISDPFGIPDLTGPNSDVKGVAFTTLIPGDTLYFREGIYSFLGSTNPGYWSAQLMSPVVSGTTLSPITISAYPGETVQTVMTGGLQPVFGTANPNLSYVRFIGFIVDPGPGDGASPPTAGPAFVLSGTGNEVGYCEVIGRNISTTDNHDGIRIQSATSCWVHHNNIYGSTGLTFNSCGVKIYSSSDISIEDNYIHDNTVGIFDKDSGIENTFRRNYIANNTDLSFYGNNQGSQAKYNIYDNVLVGGINLHNLNTSSNIYNNLILGTTKPIDSESGANIFNQNFWNNICLGGAPIQAFRNPSVAFTPSGSTAPLDYMDYNVYNGAPNYEFGEYTVHTNYNLAEFQSHGFELHAQVTLTSDIFIDTISYILKSAFTTAGRYGDMVGTRYPTAKIMDVTRYGPDFPRSATISLTNNQGLAPSFLDFIIISTPILLGVPFDLRFIIRRRRLVTPIFVINEDSSILLCL